MSTELLGLIIITGSILAFALKYHQRQREDAKELTMSAKKLQKELEQSADNIIRRMEANIHYLEELLLEAEKQTSELERQLKIASYLEGKQTTTFTGFTNEKMPRVEELQTSNNNMTTLEHDTTAFLNEDKTETTKKDVASDILATKDLTFAQILAKSMDKSELHLQKPREKVREEIFKELHQEEQQEAQEEFSDEIYLANKALDTIDTEENTHPKNDFQNGTVFQDVYSEKEDTTVYQMPQSETLLKSEKQEEARRLLLEGYSTLEIAKKVHLGKGAIELLREIEAKKK